MSEISTQSLYRKYRPETFVDVRGQDHVVTALKNSLENNSLSHAYLFSGVRGTGKTSIARILASELNTSPEDVIEIDAASHTGVENIRELRDGVATRPFSSDYKIYIIDEAHMLSKAAFNALLKTLEEPPSHVIFVLATTEKHKILDTIISRCQVFDFAQPGLDDLEQLVVDICKKEKVTIDDDSKFFIATRGNGSFRDTLSFLQQVIANFGDTISIEKVLDVFSFSSGGAASKLLESIVVGEKDAAFDTYAKYIEKGGDGKILFEEMLEKTRASLLIKNSKVFKEKYKKEYAPNRFQYLEEIRVDSRLLQKMLEMSVNMNRSHHPEIAFEIGLINLFN